MPENRKSTANPSAKFIFAAQTAEVGLEHDPEKCAAVFGKDHAQTMS
jgi:hypothetical protein